MVNVYLAEGFEEVEAITVIDMLRRAGILVTTISVSNKKAVKGAHDIVIEADKCINKADENCQLIYLPGGMPGVTNLLKSKKLVDIILNHANKGKLIAAICAAPMILGELSLVKGKDVVCYPGFEGYFDGGNVLFDNVCVDGNIITSRGAGTALELSYRLIEILKDKETAENIKAGIIDIR